MPADENDAQRRKTTGRLDAIRDDPALRALEAEIAELERLREWRRAGLATMPRRSSHHVARSIAPASAPAEASEASAADRAAAQPAPRPDRELLCAHELARHGDHELGIAYAKLHVPARLAYTIGALQANAALARGDEEGWLGHVNAYIGHFGAAPLRLRRAGDLLGRLSTDSLPEITGGPLVSVIMPAWNGERTIRAAAQSILAQTWRNLELLIVDDASDDRTWAIMQQVAALDGRVRIFRNKVNVGPYVAKNIALSMAQGAWITGHDADDWAHPQRLEHHMKAILGSARPPRASTAMMVRFEEDGRMDRFAPISSYSCDGVARLASISCTYDAGFLRDRLGGWDNIRFGADSELIARAEILIGEEMAVFEQIGILCMNLEGSLTNSAAHGVDRLYGLSPARQDYLDNYTAWHRTLKEDGGKDAKLAFPPGSQGARPFPAPEAATVPLSRIRRNHAALTGDGLHEPVTALCASKRPWFLDRVARMLKAQTHENLHVVYVAHGPGHDIEAARRSFDGLKSVTVVELPDAGRSLGEALNLGLDHCRTDLVAKIDDDDFYGPGYIRSALAAFRHHGCEDVAIVGRTRVYCYVEEKGILVLRFGAKFENSLQTRVFGGTMLWSRKALQDQRFIDVSTGEDSAFFNAAAEKGMRIFSAEPQDYVYMRYGSEGTNTWTIGAQDFLKAATVISDGLRLDLAYGSKEPPVATAVPKRLDASEDSRVARGVEPGFSARLGKLIADEDADPALRKYRGLLMSKRRMKAVAGRLVPELHAPRTYREFASIDSLVPPESRKFVLKPASGSHSRGVFCLERLDDDLFRDITTGVEYSLAGLKEKYRAEFDLLAGTISLACFTEEYVSSEPGFSRPHDYKAYCFGGHVALIMQKAFVSRDRADWRFKFWSPDWQDLGPIKYPDRCDPDLAAPALGARAVGLMARLSERIARPFARIDLYITDSAVFFSEVTPKPNGGVDHFNAEWDQRLGRLWADHLESSARISRDWIMNET